jgi:hypothetical protein
LDLHKELRFKMLLPRFGAAPGHARFSKGLWRVFFACSLFFAPFAPLFLGGQHPLASWHGDIFQLFSELLAVQGKCGLALLLMP